MSLFRVDRAVFVTRRAMVAAVKFHIATGCTVQIEDTHYSGDDRLRYEIQPSEVTFHLFDAHCRQIGAFASVAALVDHAETVTGT